MGEVEGKMLVRFGDPDVVSRPTSASDQWATEEGGMAGYETPKRAH